MHVLVDFLNMYQKDWGEIKIENNLKELLNLSLTNINPSPKLTMRVRHKEKHMEIQVIASGTDRPSSVADNPFAKALYELHRPLDERNVYPEDRAEILVASIALLSTIPEDTVIFDFGEHGTITAKEQLLHHKYAFSLIERKTCTD